jgi:hypothetical protein
MIVLSLPTPFCIAIPFPTNYYDIQSYGHPLKNVMLIYLALSI